MSCPRNLREAIEQLESQNDLRRVRKAVSPRYEAACLLEMAVKRAGPALLFENIEGNSMPVLGNLFGTRARLAAMLGVGEIDELPRRLEALLAAFDPSGPKSFLDKLRMLPRLKEIADMMPKDVSNAPCQEVDWEAPDLTRLPVLTHWPRDGGPFITMGLAFTQNPNSGVLNCGLYRMQVYGPRETGMHWQRHKGGADHARAARERALKEQATNSNPAADWMQAARDPQAPEQMARDPQTNPDASAAAQLPSALPPAARLPVAVAIGCPPVETFCGALPAPPDVNEMMIAGFIRGEPVRMAECRTIPGLRVPAEAEIVLEGYVDPFEARVEGPFGDHTGYYSPAEPFPVFHVEHITTRRDPVYLATVVGQPVMEDAWWGEAIVRLTLPVLKRQFPEIVDMHLPPWGVMHNLMIVSIRKAFPGHARKVMHGLWGLGQAMFTKVIVVVDHDVDVCDYADVCFRALASIDPRRDFEIVMGPLDQLDHAGQYSCYGGKVGIDATTKWPEEGLLRPWPEILHHTPETLKKAEILWNDIQQ